MFTQRSRSSLQIVAARPPARRTIPRPFPRDAAERGIAAGRGERVTPSDRRRASGCSSPDLTAHRTSNGVPTAVTFQAVALAARILARSVSSHGSAALSIDEDLRGS